MWGETADMVNNRSLFWDGEGTIEFGKLFQSGIVQRKYECLNDIDIEFVLVVVSIGRK